MIKILRLSKAHNLKRIVFLLNLVVIVFISNSPQIYSQGGSTVDLETARTVARNYCLKTDKKYAHSVESDLILSLAETKTANKNVLYYVFNINKEDGFIIVSADRNITPVLCYVPHGIYNIYPESRPPAFNEWLDAFTDQIEYSLTYAIKNSQSQDLWNTYTSKGQLDVETMVLKLTSKWDQTAYFNAFFPQTGINGHPASSVAFGGRTPAGCVATAMGQIMYYYKWPLNGIDSHSYDDPANPNSHSNCGLDDPSYGTLSFYNHTDPYDYSLMVDVPSTTNTEISRLIYNSAVSVDMDLAFCQSWTNTFNVENALRTYFDYNTSIDYIIKSDYSDNKWDSILIDQIRKERPIQYRGQSGPVGHSWICSGYQIISGTTQFWFNFGWGGYCDGYYTLAALNNVGGNDFSSLNGAVINIYPTSQPNLTIPTASVSPDPVYTSTPVTINFSVTNSGTRDAVASTAKCYMSTNDTLDKNDIYLKSISIPSLIIGQSSEISDQIIIGDQPGGNYYILFEADTYHDVHESDESDNIKPVAIELIQSSVNTGDYQSAASGNWIDLSTWQYNNGTEWVAATTIPNSTAGNITIRSSHIITLSNSITIDQVNIMTSGQLSVSPGNTLTIADGTDEVDFSVNGTLVNSGTISSIGKLAFNSLSIYEHAQDGGSIPIATWDVNSNCNITGIIVTAPTIPLATQPFGNFTWNSPLQNTVYSSSNPDWISLAGQLRTIAGNFNVVSTGPADKTYDLRLGQTSTGDLTVKGNFLQTGGYFLIEANGNIGSAREMTIEKDFSVEQECVFGISYIKGIGTLNVDGNFSSAGTFNFLFGDINNNTTATLNVTGNCSITDGTLNMSDAASTGTLNVSGNFSHTAGTITETSATTGNGVIVFKGSGTQTYTSGGTLSNTINFAVDNGAYLQMGTGASPSVISSGSLGTFTILSGATLGITSPVGITATGATGNIQVSGTRTYNSGANYIYNGSGAQVSGDGLPATVNSFSVSGTSNLSLTGSPLTVTNTLTIGSGTNLNIGALQQVTTKDFTNSGTMIIESTALNSNGSFIATGTLTQSVGLVTYKRQMRPKASSGDLHFFSSPVGDLTISGFKSANSNVSQIWSWQETDATWPVISSGSFINGKGYNLSQTTGSDGLISFTGSVVNSASITATSPYKSGYTARLTAYDYGVGHESDPTLWAPGRSWTNYGAGGWNLLGNPFTSAMNAGTFVSTNTSSFDPNYKALYIFDGTTGQYKYAAASVPGYPTGMSSFGDKIQAGQGFFVLALYDGIGFNFTSGMQVHNTTVSMTKSGEADLMTKVVDAEDPWPGLQLKVKYGDNEGLTTIVYNENMTAGLDPGYDVGQYSAGPEVEIYTSLVSGSNGVNFARQALPVKGCENNIVPVGIDSEKGGEVTFSAYTVPLENCKFYLEDRKLGIFTDLNTDTYTVTLPEKTQGSGRFFLHASAKMLPDIHKNTENPSQLNMRVWLSFNYVIIEGAVSSKATAAVYNLQGSKIFETRLAEGTYNTFPMPSADKGVYIVKVTDGPKVFIKKVVYTVKR
jgi:hypothetical protein